MFHVPPERCRITHGPMASDPGIPAGSFLLESCEPGWFLVLICDDGRCPEHETGWEHVSVRASAIHGKERSRIPSWKEMCLVKAACWDADEVVMQLHPAEQEYINRHPHVLHLWRPIHDPIPTPPLSLV